MDINNLFQEIINYAHCWNWAPDWFVVKEIYEKIPDSYSVLTPFAYSYLEELIRSTTSEYGRVIYDKNGNIKRRKVGLELIKLAKSENNDNTEYILMLDEIKEYFKESTDLDSGDNRNSTDHGYMHPRYWTKESFEKLLYDISKISKYARF